MPRSGIPDEVRARLREAVRAFVASRTQTEAAPLLGVAQPVLSAILLDKHSIGLSVLLRLADATGRSLDCLVGRTSDTERLQALVAALPACDVCGEPATHETRQRYPFCREHAPGGCDEFRWAKALEGGALMLGSLNIRGCDWRLLRLASFAAVLVQGRVEGAPEELKVDLTPAIRAEGEPVDRDAFLGWLDEAPQVEGKGSLSPVMICGARVNAAMLYEAILFARLAVKDAPELRLAPFRTPPLAEFRAHVDGDMTALVVIGDGWRVIVAPLTPNKFADDPDPVWPEPHHVEVLS